MVPCEGRVVFVVQVKTVLSLWFHVKAVLSLWFHVKAVLFCGSM